MGSVSGMTDNFSEITNQIQEIRTTVATVNTTDTVCNVIFLVTLPIYVLFIVTIIRYRKDKELKHGFYWIILSNGLADILRMVVILLGRELARYGFIPEFYIWMGDLSATLHFSAHKLLDTVQRLGVLWIAINRLTALHFCSMYQQIWTSGRIVLAMIAFQWINGIASGIYTAISSSFQTNILPNNKSIRFDITKSSSHINSLQLYRLYLLEICTLLIYIFILSAALRKKIQREKLKKSKLHAFKTAVAAFFICSGLFIADLFRIFQFEKQNIVDRIGITLFTSSSPYLLLIFSCIIRERFVLLICRRSFKKCSSKVEDVRITNFDNSQIEAAPSEQCTQSQL